MQATPLKRLADLWLGTDPVQRLRLRQTSLAMALMALCAPVLHYCVLIAHGERSPWLWLWTAWSVGGMALFYGCIRSGHSCRFTDPSLTSVQIAFAISSAAFGYALAGPLRGAVFPVLTLILMFGMFQLRARSAYALSFFALVLFGVVMTVMTVRHPDSYPPLVEFGHFLMLALMLPAVAVAIGVLVRGASLRTLRELLLPVALLGAVSVLLLTRKYGLTRLVWYEVHTIMTEAIQRETAIKRWPRQWKINLIERDNPLWDDLYAAAFEWTPVPRQV